VIPGKRFLLAGVQAHVFVRRVEIPLLKPGKPPIQPYRNTDNAPCPIHFTFFVKWVGKHEFTPAETVIML
jgi:hypothetical protein